MIDVSKLLRVSYNCVSRIFYVEKGGVKEIQRVFQKLKNDDINFTVEDFLRVTYDNGYIITEIDLNDIRKIVL